MYKTADRTYSKPWVHNEEEKPHKYFASARRTSLPPAVGSTEPELYPSFGFYKKNANITTQGFSTFGPEADRRAQIELEKTWRDKALPYDPYLTAYGRANSGMLSQSPLKIQEMRPAGISFGNTGPKTSTNAFAKAAEAQMRSTKRQRFNPADNTAHRL